jgi:hypothetical protein
MQNADKTALDMSTIEFDELEDRYGHENACAILRTLENFEGVKEAEVAQFSMQDRLHHVFDLMKEGMRFQTRH